MDCQLITRTVAAASSAISSGPGATVIRAFVHVIEKESPSPYRRHGVKCEPVNFAILSCGSKPITGLRVLSVCLDLCTETEPLDNVGPTAECSDLR